MSKRFEEFATRADELVEAGREHGVEMRSVGGIAVWARLGEKLREKFGLTRDSAKDIDLVAPQGTPSDPIKQAFVEKGYTPDERLIAWRGDTRHQYFDLDESGNPVMEIDVFLGCPPACHKFDLPDSAFSNGATALPSTELLLQKLQIVESSSKDLMDISFLLMASRESTNGNQIDHERVADLMSKDWGFYYTTTNNLEKVLAFAPEKLEDADVDIVREEVAELSDKIESAPKSRKWKLRAKVGTKMSWYEEVEELDR